MIVEDYVSFEVAKLLKEKEFNEPCYAYWFHMINAEPIFNDNMPRQVYNNKSDTIEIIGCPTHQMTLKWLREKGIYITIVYGDYPSLNKVFWTPQIDSLEGFNLPDSFYKEYDKYEEAVEAAIKYCLENLI